MEQTFFTDIKIEKVRHLENIRIPLGTQKRKHLILTGKNGSGKTSVLEAMVRYIQSFLGEDSIALEKIRRLQKYYFALNHLKDSEQNRQEFYKKSLNSEG